LIWFTNHPSIENAVKIVGVSTYPFVERRKRSHIALLPSNEVLNVTDITNCLHTY